MRLTNGQMVAVSIAAAVGAFAGVGVLARVYYLRTVQPAAVSQAFNALPLFGVDEPAQELFPTFAASFLTTQYMFDKELPPQMAKAISLINANTLNGKEVSERDVVELVALVKKYRPEDAIKFKSHPYLAKYF